MLELLYLSMPYENSDKGPDRSFGFITDNLISGIPYSQLSKLSITDRGLSPMHGHKILLQCVSLVCCFLEISQWEEHEVILLSPAPVILAHLWSLIVRFSGEALEGQISPFFRAFTLPALIKFTIAAPYAADEDIIDDLIWLQICSCAPIRLLGLLNIRFSYDKVSNFLRLLPQPQYLQIEPPRNGHCYSYAKILTAISQQYLGSSKTRILAAGFNARRLDLSHFLGDNEVLDAIESRCWRQEVTPASVDSNVVGSQALKSLNFVEILWQNVPLEWLSIKKRMERRMDDMKEIYAINIRFSLESQR
ncbi:hypothetical protein J132_10010 [Termitomyces sp. J132]|nr:hypothetical protein J132_10010 [Termitomyces sp. J132]